MSYSNFVVYTNTGVITHTGVCASEQVANQALGANTHALDTGDVQVNQQTNYILGGEVTPRPVCPVAAVATDLVVVLTNVPVGSTISVSGDATLNEVAQDTTVVLTFEAAGTYNVSVKCFPALDYIGSFILS